MSDAVEAKVRGNEQLQEAVAGVVQEVSELQALCRTFLASINGQPTGNLQPLVMQMHANVGMVMVDFTAIAVTEGAIRRAYEAEEDEAVTDNDNNEGDPENDDQQPE